MKPGLILIVILMHFGCNKDTASPEPPLPEIPDNLKTGLIAYYPFTGNSNDESGNRYHSTVMGAILTADRFNAPNRAYSFNGINQFLLVPAIIKGDSLNEFTISCWINPDINAVKSAYAMISFKGRDSVTPCSNFFSLQMTGQQYQIRNGLITTAKPNSCITTIVTDTFPSPPGKWVHLVFTQVKAGTLFPYFQYYQYFNGIKSTKVSASGFNPLLTSFTNGGAIGTDVNYQAGDRFFQGKIDDIRIYNRVLSAAEILQLYNLN